MAINFPDNPNVNDVFSTSSASWRWSGIYWAPVAFGSGGARTTVYPANGDISVAATYQPGSVDVYRNGWKQVNGDDFTATNGTSIAFVKPFGTGEVVEVLSLGVISALDGLLKANNLSDIVDFNAARTNLKQKWITLDDRTVTGANAATLDFDMKGYRTLRLSFELYFPASVPATALTLRTSSDGGTTFAAGASDYRVASLYGLSTTPQSGSASYSYGQFTPGWQAGQSTEVPVIGDAKIFSGASGKRFSVSALSYAISSDDMPSHITVCRALAGAQTHFRLVLADGSANIGIGSRFILEGC